MSFFSTLRHLPAKDSEHNGKSSQSTIVKLSVNNSGSRVVNARSDRSVRIWKMLSSSLVDPIITANVHSRPVTGVAWVPGNDTSFATVGLGRSVKIWKANGTLEREISVTTIAPSEGCKLVSFSPDGTCMVVASNCSTLHLYAVLENFAHVASYTMSDQNGGDLVADIQWTNRGHNSFFVGLVDGRIAVFRAANRNLVLAHTLTGCRSVTCLLVDPRGQYVAAGSKDGVVSFWRTSDMVNVGALTNIDQEVSSLACSRDGAYVCVGYKAGSNAKVYDTENFEEVYEIPDSTAGIDSVSHVAWCPTKAIIVYAAEKGRVMKYARREDRTEDEKKRR